MQHFKLVNWLIRVLISRTGYYNWISFFFITCGEQTTDKTKMDTIENGNLDGNMRQEKTCLSFLSKFDLDVPLNRFLANAGTFAIFTILLIRVSMDQFYENHEYHEDKGYHKDTLGFESGAYFFLGFFSFSKFCDDIYTLINFKPMNRFFYNFWRCYGLLMNTMFGLSLTLRLIRLIFTEYNQNISDTTLQNNSPYFMVSSILADTLQNFETTVYANFIVIAIIR